MTQNIARSLCDSWASCIIRATYSCLPVLLWLRSHLSYSCAEFWRLHCQSPAASPTIVSQHLSWHSIYARQFPASHSHQTDQSADRAASELARRLTGGSRQVGTLLVVERHQSWSSRIRVHLGVWRVMPRQRLRPPRMCCVFCCLESRLDRRIVVMKT